MQAGVVDPVHSSVRTDCDSCRNIAGALLSLGGSLEPRGFPRPKRCAEGEARVFHLAQQLRSAYDKEGAVKIGKAALVLRGDGTLCMFVVGCITCVHIQCKQVDQCQES